MCLSYIFFPNAEKLLCSSLHEERIRRRGGGKISYFKFPQEKHLFDEWICAILRDVGRHFKVTDNTCVCSRHYPNLLAQAIHNYHSNHPVGRMDNLG